VFDAAYGPSRFFFGELFASDRTGAPTNLGVNTSHDRHAAAIGRWLVARDGFDFLLYYLPDVDMAQHRLGPEGALDAVADADRSIGSLLDAGGGVDAFLAQHALVLLADHGQTAIHRTVELAPALQGLTQFAGSSRSDPDSCQVALAASNRIGMIYRLTGAPPATALAARLGAVEGVDLVAYLDGHGAVVESGGGEVRFRPGGDRRDLRGGRWSVAGDLGVLGLEPDGERLASATYPNALERVWSLLRCVNAGEVVASAGPGVEFVDGGGSHHLGGGSHGSLARDDSLVPLLTAGFEPPPELPAEPGITDVYGLVRRHFGL
jgi:hypothetical protein